MGEITKSDGQDIISVCFLGTGSNGFHWPMLCFLFTTGRCRFNFRLNTRILRHYIFDSYWLEPLTSEPELIMFKV